MKLLQPLALALILTNALLVSMPASAENASIDVMVLYTDEMLQETPDPDARIALMTSWINSAFSQSNVDATINLVHSQKINFTADGQTNGNALDALRANSEVAALRQTHGADMVALITKTGPYCGMAYVPDSQAQGQLLGKDWAFSVVGSLCVDAFAHELGHNMGLGHSAAQGSAGSLFDWARGHGINDNFVTTMAYNSAYNAATVQRFSNPSINTCNGLPCGIDHSQSNGADAVRNLNQVASEVANYLASNDGGGDNGTNGGDDTEAPSDPADLNATIVQTNSVTLSWLASNDNVGVDHYEIFRDNFSVGTSSNTNYTDGGLNADTTFQYRVIAKDEAGNSSGASNLLNVTTLQAPTPADTTAPSAPQKLKATKGTRTSINLSWKAATDNIAVTGYKVFRDGAEIASSAATFYADNDSNLAPVITYYYEVKAVDAAGNISNTAKILAAKLKKSAKPAFGAGSHRDNLLNNGHFDDVEGWQAVNAKIQLTKNSTAGKRSLLIKKRSSNLSGARQIIDQGMLENGADYVFQTDIRIDRSKELAPVVAALVIPTASGTKLQLLASANVKSGRWRRLASTFTLSHTPTGPGYLYFYGPNQRSKIRLDEVLLKKVNSSASAVTLKQVNVVNNQDFEKSVDGWKAFAGATLIRDTDAYAGNGAAKLSNRHSVYSGLGQSLLATLIPGESYNFSAAMKHTGSIEPQSLKLYLYYQTEEHVTGQWLPLAETSKANADTWAQLTGSLALSTSPILEAYLLAFGPDENVDLHVDEVIIKLAD